MINISAKYNSLRIATAKGRLLLDNTTIETIQTNKVPKGNPLEVSKVVAVMAAKNTSQIIPYCHQLSVDGVDVEYQFGDGYIDMLVTVHTIYKTGVEVEAMVAAGAGLLNMYDMLKMIDDTLAIGSIELLSKKGGKSDFGSATHKDIKAAVVVLSDTVAAGTKQDKSGQIIIDRLKGLDVTIAEYIILPDEKESIRDKLIELCDDKNIDLVLTTGGTGFSPRDVTPEATALVIEKEAPGISEMLRSYGQQRTPYSMLSRGIAGIRGNSLIINLPGSSGGVRDAMNSLFPSVLHSFNILSAQRHD